MTANHSSASEIIYFWPNSVYMDSVLNVCGFWLLQLMSLTIGICWVKSSLSKLVYAAFHQQLTKTPWYHPTHKDLIIFIGGKLFLRLSREFFTSYILPTQEERFEYVFFPALDVSFGWSVSTNSFFCLPVLFILQDFIGLSLFILPPFSEQFILPLESTSRLSCLPYFILWQ